MAWCPHCAQDRAIQRQIILHDYCPICSCSTSGHEFWCRGPVGGALDVCSYCNTQIFAKALDASTYERLSNAEEQGRKEKDRRIETLRSEALERSGGCVLLILIVGALPLVTYLFLRHW